MASFYWLNMRNSDTSDGILKLCIKEMRNGDY
jgi:hypothetical protein